MNARSAAAGLGILVVTLVGPTRAFSQAAGTPARGRRVSGENRLFLRFIEDAAIVPSYWLEGQARLLTNVPALDARARGAGEATTLAVGPVFALNVAEDFEFGARVAVVNRDPDRGGSDTGITDVDLWGKVSVVSDPVRISLGLLLTAPTGNEDRFLGTGETDVEFFGAIRKDFAHLTLAGNAGFRINQDPDFRRVDLEGESSVLVGAAILFPAGDRLVLSAEWALETERIDGRKNDSRLLGGFEYRPGESLMFRGAVGGGLADGSPDFEAAGSAVWLF